MPLLQKRKKKKLSELSEEPKEIHAYSPSHACFTALPQAHF